MKVVGIDLAGNPKNDTGFCILHATEEKKHVSTSIVHSDSEILEKINKIKPDLVAIDAPLTFNGKNRRCDEELKEYGALPVTLRGMEKLACRGSNLAKQLKENKIDYIEVHSTTTAKILGLYAKDEINKQKNLIASGIVGSIGDRILSKDELDAVFAAITAYLHLKNKTTAVGDEEGTIMIPTV